MVTLMYNAIVYQDWRATLIMCGFGVGVCAYFGFKYDPITPPKDEKK